MEEILKNTKIQLEILGYKIQENEQETLKYLIDKQISQILYICGLEEIIKPLIYVIIDKVCAEFLKNKLAQGQDIGINISDNVKDIKIGDVSVSFAENTTKEEKLNLIIAKMERDDFDYSPYSKMRW